MLFSQIRIKIQVYSKKLFAQKIFSGFVYARKTIKILIKEGIPKG